MDDFTPIDLIDNAVDIDEIGVEIEEYEGWEWVEDD